jgi:hypothetical protein
VRMSAQAGLRRAAVVLLVLLAAAQPAHAHDTGHANTTVCATLEPPASLQVHLRRCTSNAHKPIGDACTRLLRMCLCCCHRCPAWSPEAPAQNRPPHVPCCWDGAVFWGCLQAKAPAGV